MNRKKLLSLLLVLSISLTGCGSNNQEETVPVIATPTESALTGHEVNTVSTDNTSTETTISQSETTSVNTTESEEEEARLKAEEEEQRKAEEARLKAEEEARLKAEEEEKARLEKEQNSVSMMYYLTVTAEEIRISKDNRVILEDIYTSLLNNINPGAVDEKTQSHLQSLRDNIKSFLNISTKRDRLQFIYNQQKASAIKSAVPNPLAVLSVSNAFDWKGLAASVAYTAVDSYSNYKTANENTATTFIMSGWELDDEEVAAIQKNRERAFDYMLDIVQEYNIDGLKTLNEKDIERFVTICATENPYEEIKLLNAEKEKYKLLGNYWLKLADCYFETSQYSQCLECINKYNELSIKIYRTDYNYLQILPKAIIAAQKEYSGDKYITEINKYADAIINNTSPADWAYRYFVAQVYLDIYSRTNNKDFLNSAYKIASENMTELLKEQRKLNEAYLNPVVEITVEAPDYRYLTDNEKKKQKKEYNEEKKRIEDYNKSLNESRKTELPSLYQPLIVNCELMYALADEIRLGPTEKKEIEDILSTADNGTFMVCPINDMYSFSNTGKSYSFEFTKDGMIIPANLLTAESKIKVTVDDNDTKTSFDCTVNKVEREGSTIDSFYAHVSNKNLKKYAWTADSKITVEITYGDAYDRVISTNFYVSTFENHWYGDKVVFSAQ